MNLEDRYRASALNATRTAYNGMTQFLQDTSKLNIDRIPSRYNVDAGLSTGADTSNLNLDRTPSRYAPK
jgi:hypothetical protein